jgi:iron complex transport system substrate-binding protein
MSGCLSGEIVVGGKEPPKRFHTVGSLSPSTSEIAAMSGMRLVGHGSAADDYPVTVKNTPELMTGMHPNLEAIAKAAPDLVIYDADLLSDTDVAKLKEAHFETYAVGGNTIEEYIQSLYKLASKMGSEDMTNQNMNRVYKAVSAAAADPVTPKPRIAILLPMPNSNPFIAGTKSFYADLVRVSGAEVVGPEATKFVPIGIEDLTKLDPDGIVVGGEKGDFSGLTKNPQLASLRAVKAGKYFGVDPSLLERRGLRVDQAVQKIHDGLKTIFKS